jgi:hypothetical protein
MELLSREDGRSIAGRADGELVGLVIGNQAAVVEDVTADPVAADGQCPTSGRSVELPNTNRESPPVVLFQTRFASVSR